MMKQQTLVTVCAMICWLGIAGLGQKNAPRRLNPHVMPKVERLRQQAALWSIHERTIDHMPPAWHRLRAVREARHLPYITRPTQRFLYSSGPAESTAWTFQGPQPIDTFQANESFGDDGNVSGIVSAIAVDLTNDPTGNTVYVGTTYGGVWKSTNALSASPTFTPISDATQTLDVGAIALGPDNAQGQPMLYVGTGKWIQDTYQGMGVLESSDGGASWTLISSADNGTEQFAGLSVTRILVDPINPQIVLMATAYSADSLPGQAQGSNASLNNIAGVYRSTDGGQTWSKVLYNPNCTDLAYDASTHTYYAAMTGNGIYSSSDQGQIWTLLADPFANGTTISSNNFYAASLAAQNGKVYALIANTQNSVGNLSAPTACTNPGAANLSGCDTGLVMSSNGGQSWTPLPVPTQDSDGYTDANALFCEPGTNGGDCQGFYDQAIALTPDGNTLLVAGLDDWALNLTTQTYSQITNGYDHLSSQVHTDQHAIAVVSNSTWYVGNDGGVWVTSDAGGVSNSTPGQSSDWADLNATLGVTTFYSVTQVENTANTPIPAGGAQDNGTDYAGANTSWQQEEGGDGGFTVSDPNNRQEFLFEEDGGGAAGLNATSTSAQMDYYSPIVDKKTITDWATASGAGSLVFPYQFVPSNSTQLVLASGCRVWTGPDAQNPTQTPAPGWMVISNDLTTSNTEADCNNSQGILLALAVAPSSPATIYAGASNGKLWVTSNATCVSASPACSLPTWTEIDAGLPAGAPISTIVINPTQPQTVLVSLWGYGSGHVFLSTNGGTSWTDISGSVGNGGLPDAPVNGVVLDPNNSNVIYAATDVGVFVATDGGAGGAGEQWQQLGPQLPDCPIMQLQFSLDGKTLMAASFGRGAWTIPTLGASSSGSNTPDFSLSLSPATQTIASGATASLTVTTSAINGDAHNITLNCTAPAAGCTFNPASVAPGASSTLTISSGSLAAGSNTVSVSGTDGTNTHSASATVTVSAAAVNDGFTGNLVAVAGGGVTQPSTSPVAANQIKLTIPTQIATDSSGNVYMLDNNGTLVEEYNVSNGTISVIAGCGQSCSGSPTANPQPATSISLWNPVSGNGATGILVDSADGLLAIADNAHNTVDLVALSNDQIIAYAGCIVNTTSCTFPGATPAPADNVSFQSVNGIALDGNGNLYIADAIGNVVDVVNTNLTTPTIQIAVGGGQASLSNSPQPATSVALGNPSDITVDGAGNLYIATSLVNNVEVSKYNPTNQQVQVWAGDGSVVGNSASATPQPATAVGMNPAGLATDTQGDLYISSTNDVTPTANQVFRVDSSDQLTLLAGGGPSPTSYTAQPATNTDIKAVGLAEDANGNLYLADIANEMLAEMPSSNPPPAKPDFSLTAATNSASISAGTTATYSLTVSPVNGFSGSVNLACSGAPSLATCSISPATATLSGSNGTATVSVATTAASFTPLWTPPSTGQPFLPLIYYGFSLAASLAFFLLRRKWARLAGIGVLLAASIACGGGSSPAPSPSPSSNPGTPAGTYTLTVTGTSGSLSHSTSLTLTVN